MIVLLESKGITDVDTHFVYNEEYWYKRVWVLPQKADESEENAMAVA